MNEGTNEGLSEQNNHRINNPWINTYMTSWLRM